MVEQAEDPDGHNRQLLECLEHRVAFHYSGLHKKLRDLVEDKFVKKEIDFLFATTGIAYGINFPAKTMFQEGGYKPIPVYMFLQMAERAGRPQYGKEGYAFVLANDAVGLMGAKNLLEGKLERAFSQINNDDLFQKFILELIYLGRKGEAEIISFLADIFYFFQSLQESKKSLMDLFLSVRKKTEKTYTSTKKLKSSIMPLIPESQRTWHSFSDIGFGIKI